MNTYADGKQESKSVAAANSLAKQKSNSEPAFQFVDNRPKSAVQIKMQELIKIMEPKPFQQKMVPGQIPTLQQNSKGGPFLHNTPIQRLKMSNSNTFYGRELYPFEIPLSFAQSIVNYVETNKIAFIDDKPMEFTAPLSYSNTKVIKWVSIKQSDIDELKALIHRKSPQGRFEAEKDAELRGDDNADLNPSGHQRNCGYCVIAHITGIGNADIVLSAMRDAGMSTGNPEAPLSLELLKLAVSKVHKKTGDIVEVHSKEALINSVTNLVGNADSMNFVLWLPFHFTIITARKFENKIDLTIHDPQADEEWDMDFLPDSQVFRFFAVFG